MSLMCIFTRVKNDESGAVTVDWVVLTAAIVGLAFVVVSLSGDGIYSFGDAMSDGLSDKEMTDLSYSSN